MNNRSKKFLMTLIVLFFVLVVWQRFAQSGPVQVPSWVLLTGLGVIFSGYMYWQTSRTEKKEDERWIEQEGRIFIRRMEEEREKRRASS
ncbi:sporulation YhaL family protein [Alteribacillus sp. YIM 98480]|uniref:sporulation YhaL family protein n=1 Tax=Alteribacillus sp. YIM 98480 TaxID=2606599 RepID=UPI001E2FBF15|nr:sporulation YhaL family protein [Alteribacillus sp. YIM 98480]